MAFRFTIKNSMLFLLLSLLPLFTGCTSLLYHPTSKTHFPPERFGLSPEDIWIPVSSSESIHGWYFHAAGSRAPKAVVVYFHGNGENISSHYLTLTWLLWNQYDFFIFDYRGYGESPGKPTPEHTVEDGKKVIQWVHEKKPQLPIAVFAQSLGGAVAMRTLIELQNTPPISLLVVDSSFASYQGAARSVLSQHWLTWIFQPLTYLVISDSFSPADQISAISPTPMVILHGESDTLIRFSLGEEVYRLAQSPKEFWKIPHGHHIDSLWRTDEYNARHKLLQKLDHLFCIQPCTPEPLRFEPWITERLPPSKL